MNNKNVNNKDDLSIIFDSVFDEIMILDENFNIIDVNKTFSEKYDIPKEEAIGKKCFELTHGSSKICQPPECKCPAENVFKTGNFNESIHSHIKNGEEIFIEFLVYPLKSHEGEVSKVVKIGRDITKRIKSQKEAQEAQANLNFILSNLNDSVITISKDLKIIYMNKKAINEFGREYLGTICYKSLMKREKLCENCSFNKLLTNYNDNVRLEANFINPHQKVKKSYEISCTPILNFNGQPIIVDLIRDVSDKKRNEKIIINSEKKYYEAYNRASLYKDILSHDINNILQVIQSSIDLFGLYSADSKSNNNTDNFIEIITNQINKGAKLISNIRKLSQIEEIDILIEPIEVNGILIQAIKYVINSFPGKEIKIDFTRTESKIFVEANDLLLDIFENILINAIKHNYNPALNIEIKITKEFKNTIEYLKIVFIDNGMGIPDDIKENIFKIAKKKKPNQGGMGLGLSLVKKIVDKYNGQIWVEDRVKGNYTKGSKFIFLIKTFHPIEDNEKFNTHNLIKT